MVSSPSILNKVLRNKQSRFFCSLSESLLVVFTLLTRLCNLYEKNASLFLCPIPSLKLWDFALRKLSHFAVALDKWHSRQKSNSSTFEPLSWDKKIGLMMKRQQVLSQHSVCLNCRFIFAQVDAEILKAKCRSSESNWIELAEEILSFDSKFCETNIYDIITIVDQKHNCDLWVVHFLKGMQF